MSTLLTAARSYYGLADTNVTDCELVSTGTSTSIVFKLDVSDEDMAGIVGRMKAMQEEASAQQAKEAEANSSFMRMTASDRLDLRAAYDRLDAATKGKFGSFSRYLAWGGVLPEDQHPNLIYGEGSADRAEGAIQYTGERKIAQPDGSTSHVGAGGRKVVHVDAPEEESVKPEAVWVNYEDTTPEQWQCRSDQRQVGERLEALLQIIMLTPEQRARYVQPTKDKIAEHFGVPSNLLTEGDAPCLDYPKTAASIRSHVDPRSERCVERMRDEGAPAVPRTCPECKLGPCKWKNDTRLKGTDGKPTSNADDTGGLLG